MTAAETPSRPRAKRRLCSPPSAPRRTCPAREGPATQPWGQTSPGRPPSRQLQRLPLRRHRRYGRFDRPGRSARGGARAAPRACVGVGGAVAGRQAGAALAGRGSGRRGRGDGATLAGNLQRKRREAVVGFAWRAGTIFRRPRPPPKRPPAARALQGGRPHRVPARWACADGAARLRVGCGAAEVRHSPAAACPSRRATVHV
mmetsp:Transcript_3445/g.14195  ORF Transcript_3445/g.14195 Transcript_3445/m.14195 type:complete len:202 (-) Transcript_3445:226-831(-)